MDTRQPVQENERNKRTTPTIVCPWTTYSNNIRNLFNDIHFVNFVVDRVLR